MTAVSGLGARIAITGAASFSTDNAAVLSTDGVTLTITSTGRRHWDRTSTALAVAIGGTPTTDAYSVNHVGGTVSFTTPHSTSAVYTIDVASLPATFVGEGKSWTANVNIDIRDHTAFSTTTADAKWRTVAPGLAGAEVTIDRFAASTTGPAFFDRLVAGVDTVVELWTDYTSRNKLEGFAFVAGDGWQTSVDGDGEESVSLTIDGALSLSTI